MICIITIYQSLFSQMSKPAHDLDIHLYSLEELLGLFELTSYDISTSDLKRAKRKVLMLHPDKSKLEPKYFLFYKKAFDVIVNFYDNQNKLFSTDDNTNLKYTVDEDDNKSTSNAIIKTINEIPTQDFQDQFNHLFESNQMGNRPDVTRNEWFTQEDKGFDVPEGKLSKSDMGDAFNRVKQQSSGLIQYNGVQDMMHTTSAGNSLLYEDNDQYACSDPFGKLQYDDLRKVHRDQTVLSVSEHDFDNMKTFKSVEEFNRDRNQPSYDPLAKEKALHMFDEHERVDREKMMKKEYQSKLQSEQYVDKNKSVMASFLQLRNGKV